MTQISATVIADSVTLQMGDQPPSRLTTVECTFHRFVLAEVNTHRAFSRNSASSRAIPIEKQIKRVLTDLAYPIQFGANQSGMQAGSPLTGAKLTAARGAWKAGSLLAVVTAFVLSRLGVHKQVTNRILEPFMWHTAIISSTEWENFFAQRCSPLAQPEIRALAVCIRDAIAESTPRLCLSFDDLHLPYVTDAEHQTLPIGHRVRVSVARCARVSFLTHNGVRDVGVDISLFNRLKDALPPHWSPFEHVAMLMPKSLGYAPLKADDLCGNFDPAWAQMRHLIPNGLDIDTIHTLVW
jgi:hypothetical protein